MRTEAAALGEELIGDRKVDEVRLEKVRESLENGPQQQVDKSIEEPQKKSPEVATRKSRPGVPTTPPPTYPPELEPKPLLGSHLRSTVLPLSRTRVCWFVFSREVSRGRLEHTTVH
jgi:hypothetical protein